MVTVKRFKTELTFRTLALRQNESMEEKKKNSWKRLAYNKLEWLSQLNVAGIGCKFVLPMY